MPICVGGAYPLLVAWLPGRWCRVAPARRRACSPAFEGPRRSCWLLGQPTATLSQRRGLSDLPSNCLRYGKGRWVDRPLPMSMVRLPPRSDSRRAGLTATAQLGPAQGMPIPGVCGLMMGLAGGDPGSGSPERKGPAYRCQRTAIRRGKPPICAQVGWPLSPQPWSPPAL
jgi:hypothetical protein